MTQVTERLPSAAEIKSLVMVLTPIIGEHGHEINNLISGSSAYTLTGDSTDRAFNPTATTLLEVGNVLATLIRDLRAKRILS